MHLSIWFIIPKKLSKFKFFEEEIETEKLFQKSSMGAETTN